MDKRRPDTEAAGRNEIRAALGVTGLLLAVALGLAPLAGTPLALPEGFGLARSATLITACAFLAVLAWQRGLASRRAASFYIASALLWTLVMALARSVAAPPSQAWLVMFWQLGFGGLLGGAVWASKRDAAAEETEPSASRPAWMLVSVLLAAGLLIACAPALAATLGTWPRATLPALLLDLSILLLLIVPGLRRGGLAALPSETLWLGVALLGVSVEAWLGLFQGVGMATLGSVLRLACCCAALLALAVLLLGDLGGLHRRVVRANALIESLAHQDGLTGLANRRRFDEVLAREWTRSFRTEQPLALLRIDVDLQQRYNERYGPDEGDELLRRLGALLSATCNRRAGDLCARISGDEFAVILPDTDISGAAVMAALVRRELAALSLPHADSATGRVTVSIGIAPTHPSQTGPQDLLRAADDALFRAKADGRDQASLAPRQDGESRTAQWAAAQGESGPGAL